MPNRPEKTVDEVGKEEYLSTVLAAQLAGPQNLLTGFLRPSLRSLF
jgi:hypothetical protein